MSLFGTKQIIKVEGMKCEHCAKHVSDALMKIAGVKNVKVNLDNKEVTVKSADGISEDLMKQAVNDAGYEYQGLIK